MILKMKKKVNVRSLLLLDKNISRNGINDWRSVEFNKIKKILGYKKRKYDIKYNDDKHIYI